MKSEETEPRKKQKAVSELQQGAAVKQERLEIPSQADLCCLGNYHTRCVNHAQIPRVNRAQGPSTALRRSLLSDVRFCDFHCSLKYIYVLM